MKLKINGKEQDIRAADDTPLLWVLRDELNLTGTKYGCGISACGACTVHVDGKPTRSCVTPISTLEGKAVRTIEDLGADKLNAVQLAWIEAQVPQCGYCQSGQIMTAVALLQKKPHPSDSDIDAALSGNICRCGTYVRVREAIHLASRLQRGAK
jgi:isoquinoline 1-oxidoreductase alpha subunit